MTSDAIQLSEWTWKNIVTWDKTEACRPKKGLFRNQAEYVLIASKGSPSPILPPASNILDPFAGAGSTLIAAHKAGHKSTGIELSPEYFEIAKKRIKSL
ncbi:MAG: DNA methyltransferase [Akkermansia sp.]